LLNFVSTPNFPSHEKGEQSTIVWTAHTAFFTAVAPQYITDYYYYYYYYYYYNYYSYSYYHHHHHQY